MKASPLLAAVIATLASIPLTTQKSAAQQANAPAQQNASANAAGAQASVGFGDEAASHAWEMSSVNTELQGKLDAKTAKIGDRVVLKTTEKVVTSDGTVVPKGSRLLGHITQVQARDSAHATSQLAIVFDRAELKNGQNIAIYTLIRNASPSASATNMNSAASDGGFGTPMGGMAGGDQTMGGARPGSGGGGGMIGATGRTAGGAGDATDDTLDRTAATTPPLGTGAGAGGATEIAGHGDLGADAGAHNAAAARAIPHFTGFPGIVLAGNSSSSGVFFADGEDVRFDTGTQMQLGIVADQ